MSRRIIVRRTPCGARLAGLARDREVLVEASRHPRLTVEKEFVMRATFRPSLLLTVFMVTAIAPQTAVADEIFTAKAVVNGTAVFTFPQKGIAKREVGATGVAIAGAEVYHGFKGDYRVSVDPGGEAGNKKANVNEEKEIKGLLKFASGK